MDNGRYDNRLSKLEFFAFRHPEQSQENILNMAMSVLETLGRKNESSRTLLPRLLVHCGIYRAIPVDRKTIKL